jgi:8-oxo-dGTP diphosphatase
MDPPAPFHPTATRRVRPTVRVGVGVVVVRRDDKKIYAGRRKGSHGASKLALPGGHLEMYESWQDCAKREVEEEMGIELTEIEYLHLTNDIMKDEEKHYITIFMIGETDRIPENREPDKCEGWELFGADELSRLVGTNELFVPLEHLLEDMPQMLFERLDSIEK